MSSLKSEFHTDMINIYLTAKKELDYNPARFLKLVLQRGGLEVAKILIAKEGTTYGLEVFRRHNRLDL